MFVKKESCSSEMLSFINEVSSKDEDFVAHMDDLKASFIRKFGIRPWEFSKTVGRFQLWVL